MTDAITATFPDRATADRAIADLASAGFAARVVNAVPETTGYDQGSYNQGSYDQGSVLVGVDAQDRADEVQQMLQRSGAMAIQAADDQGREAMNPPAGTLPLDANGTIGGVTPSAVTVAPPQPAAEQGADPIGGMAPSSVSSAPPETPVMTPMTDTAATPDQHDNGDAHLQQSSGAPADSTIVSPGMETSYAEREAMSGNSPERRPITDEDIIAEAQRERGRDQSTDQSADLDLAPDAGEQYTSPPASR